MVRSSKLSVGETINGHRVTHAEAYASTLITTGYAPVLCWSGKEQSGKTSQAIEFARRMHNEYNILHGELNADTVKKQLTYTVKEFLQLLLELTENYKETGERQKKAIFLDEAGENVDRRSWWDSMNRAIKAAVATQGYLRNVYIFMLPKVGQLDKPIQSRIDLLFWMQGKGVSQPFKRYYEMKKHQATERMRSALFPQYSTPLPPADLMESYQEKEFEYKENLLRRHLDDILEEEKEDEHGDDYDEMQAIKRELGLIDDEEEKEEEGDG